MPAPSLQDAQQIFTNQGLRTQYGVILPPGARVAAFVRSTGLQSGDDTFLATNLVPTLALGLARVRAGLGDFVVCLPGHTETVDAAATTAFTANLVAGTKIVGVGRGANTPTFTWGVVGAQWLIGVADVVISGLRLQTAGIPVTLSVNTTLAITVTANDFGFYNNEVETGTSTATSVVTMSFTGGAARYDVSNNVFRGGGGGVTSTVVLVSGTGADGRIRDNEMLAGAVSATGLINITGAAPRLKILRNDIVNTTASSIAAVAWSNVAATGQCAYNNITVFSTGAQTGGTTGITVGGTNNLTGYHQNFVVNDVNKSGILQPAADT